MSAEIIKGPFWSNCFLEAAKAKIRHPFKVKVTVVPRSEARCPHFLWSDGRYDYDFGVERRLVGAQILLFRGFIRRRGLGFNQKYKERMRKAWRRRAGGRGGHLMDIEKLIETLRQRGVAYVRAYGRHCSICDEVVTALSTLHAENEKLRDELNDLKTKWDKYQPRENWETLNELCENLYDELEQKSKLIAQQAAELERRDTLLKEQEAELEQVKAERDAAVSWAQKYTESIDMPCVACKHNTGDYVCTAICGNCGPMGAESCKWEFDFSGELKED